MKTIIGILFMLNLSGIMISQIPEITDELPVNEFEKIEKFILNNGDRQTYRNKDNDNPHYHLGDFDLYLNAIDGYRNIGNDPKIPVSMKLH